MGGCDRPFDARAALSAVAAIAAAGAPGLASAQDLDLRGRSGADAPQILACADAGAECRPLLGVSVTGATAIAARDLLDIYQPYLGRDVSITDIARIAERITQAYRARGYFLSRAYVPVQDESGVARINVIEGRIADVRVEGDGAAQAAPYLDGVENAPIAQLADLDRRLALANDAPGVRVRTRMEPMEGDPRAHRLIVTADLTPVSAQALIDNRGDAAGHDMRFYARAAQAGVLAERDEVAAAVLTTPQDHQAFSFVELSYGYTFANGGALRVAGAVSRSEDATGPAITPLQGDTETLSVFYELPLIRSSRTGLWLGAGFDTSHQENDWAGGGGYTDELRVARFALRGLLDEDGQAGAMIVQVSLGLDVLGASSHSPLLRSRADADAEFAKIDFYGYYQRAFGDHLSFYAALAGQRASDPLLGAEEFYVGGAQFGRAYNYGELAGDHGLAGIIELRAGTPLSGLVSYVQGYVFADSGQVWNFGAGDQSLSSAGAGVRVSLDDWLTANIEFARPLSRTPYNEPDRDWRQFFSLTASY